VDDGDGRVTGGSNTISYSFSAFVCYVCNWIVVPFVVRNVDEAATR